ncbi:ATP-binding protein [Thermodesulfobacteriota bacterium]
MPERNKENELGSIINALDKKILRAKTLHDLSLNLSLTTDLNKIYKTAVNSCIEVLDTPCGAFLTFDKDSLGFSLQYQSGDKLIKDFYSFKGTLPDNFETLSIEDIKTCIEPNKQPELIKLLRALKATVLVPIRFEDQLFGMIIVSKKSDNSKYTLADKEFLFTLCSLIAITIENAGSQQELNYKVFELSTLYEISKELSSSLDITQIQTAIIFCCMGVVGAKRGAIFLYNAEDGSISMNHSVNFSSLTNKKLTFNIDKQLISRISKMNDPFFLSDLKKNSKEYNLFSKVKEALVVIENPLIIPQIIKDRLVGYLVLAEKINTNPYATADINLLSALSYQSSLAIINAQSYLEVETLAKKNADLYEELKIATKEKLEAERLATLGMVVSTIIHDIKNPLTSIRYFSAILGETTANPDEKKTYVNIIDSETDRLVGMIEDILLFARGGDSSLNMKLCSINDLLDEVCVVLRMNFKDNNIRVLKEVNCKADTLIDEEKIKRVLYNLSYNARDALKSGGKLILSASENKGTLNISVSDTGNGIPEKIIDTIFAPFVTHGKKRGTGLGLAISKKIIEDHDGELSFITKKNKGTTFTITLPLNSNKSK